MNFAPGKIPLRGNSRQKCINSLPAQETAKHWAVWLASVEQRRCSNEAKMRKRLKFARVPQTRQSISAASAPKFTILWRHMEEILLLNKFFPIVDTRLSCEDTARQSYAMVPRWRFFVSFLRPVFSASHVQHTLDMHSKFALKPHHGRHPLSEH